MIRCRVSLLVPVLVLGQVIAPRIARAVPPGFSAELVHGGLQFPVGLRFAPDGRLFYLERSGRIMVCPDWGRASPIEWATVPTWVSLESGLLGLDFHPDFPDSPFVYVFHSRPDSVSAVARLIDTGGVGAEYATLFRIRRSSLHLGGRSAFGPDRMLYVTSGDQAQPDNAQSLSNPFGKLLRLTPLGEPAPGNPFPSNPVIAALGIRNAFGLCFDSRDGTGFFTENGSGCDDELNRVKLGANYGWSASAQCGTVPPGTEPPLVTFNPSIAPTGCCVCRGIAYPEFDGDLFLGSWNDRTLKRVAFHPGDETVVDSVTIFHNFGSENRVVDVTVGPNGILWVCTAEWSRPGAIWRILPPPERLAVGEPSSTSRLAAWPNPFTDVVVIKLPASFGAERLEVLDLHGRLLRRWSKPSTQVTWDGLDQHGRVTGAGIYFANVSSRGMVLTRRIVRVNR